MDTFDGMRTFVAVAQEGSFTAAARRLNMTTKLASKYVGQLEERLGAQLFNRTTRSVTLTDIGHAYLERCRPLLDQFDELEAVIQERQSDLAGPIRITAPTGFGSINLVQALAPFLAGNPKVSVDLHLTDRHSAIVEEGFDMAIRIGELQDSSLIARRLKWMRVCVCASPDYLARMGEPEHPAALSTHNCLINQAHQDPFHWRFNIEGEELRVPVQGRFQADAPRAAAEMAVAGIGITVCPYYALEPFLATGKLRVLFAEYEAIRFGLYAVYPPNRHLTARVRGLIDHLATEFADGR